MYVGSRNTIPMNKIIKSIFFSVNAVIFLGTQRGVLGSTEDRADFLESIIHIPSGSFFFSISSNDNKILNINTGTCDVWNGIIQVNDKTVDFIIIFN